MDEPRTTREAEAIDGSGIVDPFERWAYRLLVLLAIGGLVSTVVNPLAAAGERTLLDLALSVASIAGTIAVAFAARGLLQGRSWGRTTAQLVLRVVLLAGVLDVFAALNTERLPIPVAAIGAALVLSRKPQTRDRPEEGGDRGRMLVIGIIVALGAAAGAWSTGPLFPG
jgi:hypothetical protein